MVNIYLPHCDSPANILFIELANVMDQSCISTVKVFEHCFNHSGEHIEELNFLNEMEENRVEKPF